MATAPTSRKLNLTRDQLAAFLTDQQQIRQFELLFSTVDELQVIVGTDFEYQADTAAATANEALAQLAALAQDTAVEDAVLNAKVQQALDAIPALAQALELMTLAPRQELGTIASQNSDNVNITGGLISGLDSPLPVASGGIGVTTAAANQVFAGPTTGAAAAPAFRALVAADIPALTSGTSILYGNGSGGFSNVTIGTGVSFSAGTLSATGSGGTVTSVTGTSPVVSSGGTTPAISLASGYGDTQNPYASKTANYVLASPNGSAGTPTFRALVASDIPALSYLSSIGVTAPITSTGGLTPTIGITQSGTASNGYLSSTDWNTFNNKQPAGTYVTSVTGTATRITSTGGTTPVIDLASGVATAGTTGSSTLIPVVTIDTYGRVTTITTAANPQGTVTSVATGTGLTGGTITSSGTISFAVAAVGTWAATPSSANLAAAMTDETGSGSLVFATQPSFASTIGVGGATASASGAGITFPATVSLSTNANTLDDYEEGSFTPVLTTSGTAPTLTYSEQAGRYVKIGSFVLAIVQIRVDITNVGTGYPRVTGLPFGTESGYLSGISIGIQNAFGTYPTTYVPNAYLAGTAAYFETAAIKIVTGGYLTFSAVYRTSS